MMHGIPNMPHIPLSSLITVLVCLACAISALPTVALAQSNAHVAVGADVSKRVFPDGDFHRNVSVGFLYRIRKHRRPENGWRFRFPQFGFNWFRADVTKPVAGIDTAVGQLRVRPLLAGVAEALVLNEGKDELSFSLLTGPAFTHFNVSGEARDAYRQRLGADPIAIDAKNTWVLRPGVSYWHDLGPRLGLHAAINYIVARPTVVVRTPMSETKSRWHADNMAFKAGLVMGIF
jgi:hypothetical protein